MTTVTSVLIDVADGTVAFVASDTVAAGTAVAGVASGTAAGGAAAAGVASGTAAGGTVAGGAVPGRPLLVRRCRPTVGSAYWRWDCRRCGEYGGGEHHRGAVARALRHCAEHPEHRSALLRPLACRELQRSPRTHPVLLDPVAEADRGPMPDPVAEADRGPMPDPVAEADRGPMPVAPGR